MFVFVNMDKYYTYKDPKGDGRLGICIEIIIVLQVWTSALKSRVLDGTRLIKYDAEVRASPWKDKGT